MRKLARPVFWLTVFTAVAIVCAVLLVTALRSPVDGPVSHYSATFTDVSGLDVGNDVRISGVQVGRSRASGSKAALPGSSSVP